MLSTGTRRRVAAGLAGSLFYLVILLGMTSGAQAANLAVTNHDGGNSPGSLAAAITQANSNPSDEDVITFASGVTGAIVLTDDLPALTGPVKVTGPGSQELTIDGSDVSYRRIFQTNADLELSGLTLQNGSNVNGGAISSTSSDLALNDVTVFQSRSITTTGKGGGIYVNGGTLSIEDSTIERNLAPSGGGIWVEGATSVSIANTRIILNDAHYFFDPGFDPAMNRGGGLRVEDSGSLNIKDSVISSNTSDSDGAAFFVDQVDKVDISGTTVAENETTAISGPIDVPVYGTARILADHTTVTDSQISRNYAPALSGLQVIGAATISRCLIDGNSGGFNTGLTLGEFDGNPSNITATVANTTITGNSGGGMAVGLSSSIKSLKLDSSTITGNTIMFPVSVAANGAGLIQMTGTATVTSSIISGNDPADVTALAKVPESIQPDTDFGGYVEGSYSFIGNSSGRKFKDLVAGSNLRSVNPKLGPLAYEGDASLQSMAPEKGSPVIDQGRSSLATDQIGNRRTVDQWATPNARGGDGTDIGAMELPSFGPPPNRFSFGKLKLNRKKGTATLQVKVPFSGKVMLLGSRTTKASKKTTVRKGTLALTIRAKGKAARQLKKQGKTRLKVQVKYTPTGGTPKTRSRSVKLIRSK